ncbi:hypothetical protein [Schumannella soli]|uniref:Peptide methionine sulfoxide reductase n=1 Tax=Schumannella soli TaxID=2590779 RepID=A0A506Y7Z7_9MICO|nr:hypothetical protein [Schumannella soli]TPW76489.1 hypothetical protein FJ657_12080 [Schumannella soli]
MIDDLDAGELAALDSLPLGWSRRQIAGEPWGVIRADHAGGRATTLTAERLGGRGHLSANIWRTEAGVLLKPCEIPAEQVHEFLGLLAGSRAAPAHETGSPVSPSHPVSPPERTSRPL